MTRVTNFGRKRTYLQAGFSHDNDPVTTQPEASTSTATVQSNTTDAVTDQAVDNDTPAPPAKKKRKRTPKSKRDGYAAQKAAEAAKLNGGVSAEGAPAESLAQPSDGEEREGEASVDAGDTSTSTPKSLSKSAKKKLREQKRKQKIESAKESRRLKRIKQKAAETTCFVCREKGHAAKDCPTTQNGEKPAKVVGICYRCGSTKHSLSKCKKPANPEDPYPYASCFVCNGKGHLASACPQNKAKGIYPNGGCCKMCGSTAHLAKDCDVRKKVTTDPTNLVGTGDAAGADEDDFHLLKRKTTEIDRDEKKEAKVKQMLDIRTGKHSGVVRAFGSVQAPPKKVVVFKG
ncbi:hypothetical protein CVT26_004213 [Gymnopilus dilepis]|uniref:CCHC-type domain-containing protein n=1 Tax=Gymnopilus dilepis TaxID=231916 RepID=A0A409YMX7_9AGAR|nr:hypothetical protein CVT26_004213 [Gymnopilus dilepis]